jgi:hypothetical protein
MSAKTKNAPGMAGRVSYDQSIRDRSGFAPYSEYLNSGIAFSSSLVALYTAWSGYHGFGFAVAAAGGLAVEPVVVVDA